MRWAWCMKWEAIYIYQRRFRVILLFPMADSDSHLLLVRIAKVIRDRSTRSIIWWTFGSNLEITPVFGLKNGKNVRSKLSLKIGINRLFLHQQTYTRNQPENDGKDREPSRIAVRSIIWFIASYVFALWHVTYGPRDRRKWESKISNTLHGRPTLVNCSTEIKEKRRRHKKFSGSD